MSEGALPPDLPPGSQDDFGRVDRWDEVRARSWAEALELRAAGLDQIRLRAEILAAADVRVGNTVVEIGCGTGPLLPALAEAVGPGGRVIGIEPQPTLARVARDRMAPMSDRCEIRVERGSETALGDGVADVCIAQTVLCHLLQHVRLESKAERGQIIMAARRPDLLAEWAVKDSNLRPWD